MCVCYAMVMSPLCRRSDSLMHLVMVCLHGALDPMTDLYYTRYVWLLFSSMTPFPVAAVLGLRYYCYWTLLFTYNAIPTTYGTRIMVPYLVDVTY